MCFSYVSSNVPMYKTEVLVPYLRFFMQLSPSTPQQCSTT